MKPSEYSKKISVVIPTLDEEKNIVITVKQLRRMLPNAQLIVSDGGSSDKTVQAAQKLVHTVCYEKIRRGVRPSIGAGRNTGAKKAGNEWIVFCDADNVPPQLFFDRMAEAFENPEVVGFGGKVMPKEATFNQAWIFEIFNLIVNLSVLFGRPALAGNAAAYKKKAFFSVGGFDEVMQASEDQDLCQRIAKKGRVVYDKSVVTYTSNRRLKKFGMAGLLLDWGRTTWNFLLGIKTKRYAIIREI